MSWLDQAYSFQKNDNAAGIYYEGLWSLQIFT